MVVKPTENNNKDATSCKDAPVNINGVYREDVSESSSLVRCQRYRADSCSLKKLKDNENQNLAVSVNLKIDVAKKCLHLFSLCEEVYHIV